MGGKELSECGRGCRKLDELFEAPNLGESRVWGVRKTIGIKKKEWGGHIAKCKRKSISSSIRVF